MYSGLVDRHWARGHHLECESPYQPQTPSRVLYHVMYDNNCLWLPHMHVSYDFQPFSESKIMKINDLRPLWCWFCHNASTRVVHHARGVIDAWGCLFRVTSEILCPHNLATAMGNLAYVWHMGGACAPFPHVGSATELDLGEKDHVNARLARALVGTTWLCADVRE